jgi:diguanylate cyclase (GGDEF)-like protein
MSGDKLLTGEIFNRTSGLPDQRVIGIARTEHYLWVLTRNGLVQMTVDGKQIHLLEPRAGLELSQAQLHGLTALPDDQVQLATSSGLWRIAAQDMTAVPADMQLHLSTIRLNQQLLTLADDHDVLVLPDRINELQLKFKLLSFQPHLEVRYFFRWQPQSDWTALGQDGTLNLTQLNPGQHQLEVMARAGGQQIYASPLQLQVPVPFWLQPVGISLLSLTTALLLWLLYHYRTRRLAQRAARLDMLVAKRTAELEHANQQLLLQSNTDSLTGLLNRRALYAASELLQAQRQRKPAELTLVLMDIDHFKRINDQHGHDIGDAVLCQVAAYLKQRLRRQDLIARWGGEEFLLLMPDTAVSAASQLIEELRQGICRLQVPGVQQTLTATFGISAVTLQQNALDQAVKAADQALYQGKAQGRDQVVTATPTS